MNMPIPMPRRARPERPTEKAEFKLDDLALATKHSGLTWPSTKQVEDYGESGEKEVQASNIKQIS